MPGNHGPTYVFIGHDLKVVRASARDVLTLREGRIVEQGTAEAILAVLRTDYMHNPITAALELRARRGVL